MLSLRGDRAGAEASVTWFFSSEIVYDWLAPVAVENVNVAEVTVPAVAN